MTKHLPVMLLCFLIASCSGDMMKPWQMTHLLWLILWHSTGLKGETFRNSGRYNEALSLHKRGLELAGHLKDTLESVQALNNIGTVYRRMGLLEEAASWHYRALTICEE